MAPGLRRGLWWRARARARARDRARARARLLSATALLQPPALRPGHHLKRAADAHAGTLLGHLSPLGARGRHWRVRRVARRAAPHGRALHPGRRLPFPGAACRRRRASCGAGRASSPVTCLLVCILRGSRWVGAVEQDARSSIECAHSPHAVPLRASPARHTLWHGWGDGGRVIRHAGTEGPTHRHTQHSDSARSDRASAGPATPVHSTNTGCTHHCARGGTECVCVSRPCAECGMGGGAAGVPPGTYL